MKARGFKRTEGTSLGWNKPFGDDHLSLWFQADKYGWMDALGSSFTLEFQLGSSPLTGTASMRSRERFHRLLSPQERETLRALNNVVLSSLPPPETNPVFAMLSQQTQENLLLGYRIADTPYIRAQDVWLHYHTREQISAWAEFLQSNMDGMIERFREQYAAARSVA
jgi:hypothetical protein